MMTSPLMRWYTNVGMAGIHAMHVHSERQLACRQAAQADNSRHQATRGAVAMLDSHCHLDRYADSRSVATKATHDGVFVIAVTNLPSHFEIGIPHVAKFARVRLALGLHPLAADQHVAEPHHFEEL